ncbi:MAG: MFS transporter [Pseudomonadota bacterium]
MNRNFWLLITGQFTSNIGSTISELGISWLVLKEYSITEFTIFSGICLLPRVILTPLLAPLFERVNKKLLMILSDIVKGICLFTMYLLFLTKGLRYEYIVSLMFVHGLVGVLFSIAVEPLYYDILSLDEYPKGTSLRELFGRMAPLIGPSATAIIMAISGNIGLLLLIDSITFFVSALCIVFIRLHMKTDFEKTPKTTGFSSYAKNLFQGLAYVSKNKNLLMLFTSLIAIGSMLGVLASIMPIYIRDHLSSGVVGLSIFQLIGNAGAIIVAIGLTIWQYKSSHSSIYSFGVGIIGIVVMGLVVTSNFYAATFIYFLLQVTITIASYAAKILLRENIEDDYKTRAYSLMSMEQLLQPITISLSGLAIKAIGIDSIVMIIGITIMIIGLVLLVINFKTSLVFSRILD